MTLAGLRSSLKMSACSIFTRCSSFRFFTILRASATRSGSISKPTALQPYLRAAVIAIRPSPQPGS